VIECLVVENAMLIHRDGHKVIRFTFSKKVFEVQFTPELWKKLGEDAQWFERNVK
jgi:hypothetical protein